MLTSVLALTLIAVLALASCKSGSGSSSGDGDGDDDDTQVAMPTISVTGSGIGRTVTISSSDKGATVYYTIDGSTPTTSSSAYGSALTVAGFGVTKTIKAIAVVDGTSSDVASMSVTVAATTLNLTSSCTVSTLAGQTTQGTTTDVSGTNARFYGPSAAVSDGSYLYVSDSDNNAIRRIRLSDAYVTTFAEGSLPVGICTDGTYLYVANSGDNTISKIVISTAEVTTLAGEAGSSGNADGTGTSARFKDPWGICTDGISLYVADTTNCLIRKIDIATAKVTTLAGTGESVATVDGTYGTAANIAYPYGIATDGSSVYAGLAGTGGIVKIDIATAKVTKLAGGTCVGTSEDDGIGSGAAFWYPYGLVTDGTNLYVSEMGYNRIRRIVIASGEVTTIAGVPSSTGGMTNGTGSSAYFKKPEGVACDGSALYVADKSNNMIRKIVE